MVKLLPALCLAPLCALAQVVCALGSGVSSYKPSSDQRPSPDTMQVAGRVNTAMKAICADHCPQLALFRNATAANAMLTLDAGLAKLVYAPQFFATVYGAYGDDGIIAILAHELGHAVDETMGASWVSPKLGPELRADSWAGCILGRIGLKDSDLASTLAALAKYPSPAHPGWPQRLPYLRTGYSHCGGDVSKFDKKR